MPVILIVPCDCGLMPALLVSWNVRFCPGCVRFRMALFEMLICAIMALPGVKVLPVVMLMLVVVFVVVRL